MSEPATPRAVGGLLSPARLEAFSDGVFAVAITLLVVNLHAPQSINGHGDLLADLGHQWPAYVSLVISFTTVGIIWINHHAVFTLVEKVDRTLLILNLLLLLAVVVIPYPTELLGEAFQAGRNQGTVMVIYNLSSVFMGAAFGGVFFYATGSPQIRHRDLPPGYVRRLAPRFSSGTVVYLLAAAVALVAPYVSLAMNGAMALYYAVLRVELGAAREPSDPADA